MVEVETKLIIVDIYLSKRKGDERMKKEKKEIKKAGVRVGLISGLIIAILVMGFTMPTPILEQNDEGAWHIVMKVNSAQAAEAAPGAGVSGWLSTFQLNYTGSTPSTALTNNASGGAYDGWGNVSGYVSADDTDTDLASEAGNYYVVRCRFNDSVKAGGNFQDIRCKVLLTVSGDETINDVSGTRVVSQNSSGDDFIWINFYWDDASDGYRILDDGAMAWNITVMAKY